MVVKINENYLKYNEKLPKNLAENIYKELMEGLLICLQDRSNNVRNLAEEIIKLSLNYVSLDDYYRKSEDFKPAITKDIKQILNSVENLEYIESNDYDKCCGLNGLFKFSDYKIFSGIFKHNISGLGGLIGKIKGLKQLTIGTLGKELIQTMN